MNRPPHLQRSNELYARCFKAIGEQPSDVETHEVIGKLFGACMELASTIATVKNYAREVPNQKPKSLQELLNPKPGKEIAEAGVETVNILFEGCIVQLEQHVKNGNNHE